MKHDVAIVGGGMVGTALACALGQAGLSVGLIEATPAAAPALPDAGFALRVSALTLASVHVLEAIGAWARVDRTRVAPLREMRVWERLGQEIHFDSAAIGEPALGYIVENANITLALGLRAAELENVHSYRPVTLDALDRSDDGVTLRFADAPSVARRCSARLVVGADGARSRVRELAQITQNTHDYHQRAVVASVRTQHDHQDTAWQRFLPDGPLAFLPLPQGYCSIVWSSSLQHAQALLDMPSDQFGAALTEAFEQRLGRVELVGERADFPLKDMRAASYCAERVALVGDAAHTVHPLAGQGANLGFLDAAALAEVTGRHAARGRDIGARTNLRRYERWRRGENQLAADVLGGFHHLFGSKMSSLAALRSAGLALANTCAPFKRMVMGRASGLHGDLPALARAGGPHPQTPLQR